MKIDTMKNTNSVFNTTPLKPMKKKVSTGSKIFDVCNYIFLFLFALICLLPYVNILATSFNTAKDTMLGGLTVYPRVFTWDNYSVVLGDSRIYSGAIISVLRVVVGSLIQIIVQYSAAYVLLRDELPFKKGITLFLTIPMFLNGGIISELIIYSKLEIYNTFWVYVLPYAFSFYNTIIIRTYLQTIPSSLLEAARIDGATEITILFKIMLPLSTPVLATILLWCAVAHWNDWTTSMYFIKDRSLYTLQYLLQEAAKDAEVLQQMVQDAIASGRPLGDVGGDISGETIRAAQIIITTLPIVCVYPFVQKYFMSGVLLGGVKE